MKQTLNTFYFRKEEKMKGGTIEGCCYGVWFRERECERERGAD